MIIFNRVNNCFIPVQPGVRVLLRFRQKEESELLVVHRLKSFLFLIDVIPEHSELIRTEPKDLLRDFIEDAHPHLIRGVRDQHRRDVPRIRLIEFDLTVLAEPSIAIWLSLLLASRACIIVERCVLHEVHESSDFPPDLEVITEAIILFGLLDFLSQLSEGGLPGRDNRCC